MTIEEIEALQLGDIIQFPNGKYGEVKSTNNVDHTIYLRMLSGDETLSVGDLPPELIDVDTQCVCPWADLSSAVFTASAAPLAQGRISSPFIERPEPYMPIRSRHSLSYLPEKMKAALFFAHLDREEDRLERPEPVALTPETMALPQTPKADGDLSNAGTPVILQVETGPPTLLPQPPITP